MWSNGGASKVPNLGHISCDKMTRRKMRGWVEEEEEGGSHLREKGIAIAMILENYVCRQAASSNVLACYVYAHLSAAFQRCPETFLPVTLLIEA